MQEEAEMNKESAPLLLLEHSCIHCVLTSMLLGYSTLGFYEQCLLCVSLSLLPLA